MPSHSSNCPGRRAFLLSAGAGLAGAGLTWAGLKGYPAFRRRFLAPSFTGRSVEDPRPVYGMPGPYPGRVVEVHHPGAVNERNRIDAGAVQTMMARGMCELTGADHPTEAWRKFFNTGDVVGVKVNPVGCYRGYNPRAVPAISSPEVLLETVAGLKEAGVHPRNIIVFERYAAEFRDAGYEKVLGERSMAGVRWFASSSRGSGGQVDIRGFDHAADQGDTHVVGYDPDHFVHMGFCDRGSHDPTDERRFQSHLSVIITRMVNKFITIPVLKDHKSAGVTLALKNLSHGLNNNVARSHLAGIYRGVVTGGRVTGPNQCNTFIPAAVNQPLLRQKATLHILDGLIGVYEGGPGAWNATWGTWRRQSLFFATDPVAMDHVGWEIIDLKRAENGWQPVGAMGLQLQSAHATLSSRLAILGARGMPDAVTLSAAAQLGAGKQEGEPFDRRQPEHITLAGSIGLGVYDRDKIDYRLVNLGRRRFHDTTVAWNPSRSLATSLTSNQ